MNEFRQSQIRKTIIAIAIHKELIAMSEWHQFSFRRRLRRSIRDNYRLLLTLEML